MEFNSNFSDAIGYNSREQFLSYNLRIFRTSFISFFFQRLQFRQLIIVISLDYFFLFVA
jgi:hypothetical protein